MSGDPEDEYRNGHSVGWDEGYAAGKRTAWKWLDSRPRYDIPAEDGGCVIVLDLRDFAAAFPEATASGQEGA